MCSLMVHPSYIRAQSHNPPITLTGVVSTVPRFNLGSPVLMLTCVISLSTYQAPMWGLTGHQYAFTVNILTYCPLIILTCMVTSCLHVLSYCFPIKLACMSSLSTRKMASLWVNALFQQELQNGRSLILHSSCIDYMEFRKSLVSIWSPGYK